MNDKETIKNRFINFEVEVDDFAINQKWEKIKYFVPKKEKKRRGAFFLLYGTFALLLISSLILTVSYFPKNDLNTSEKENATLKNNKTIFNTKIINSKNARAFSLTKKQNKKHLTKPNAISSPLQKNTASVFDPEKEVIISSAFITEEKISGLSETKNISEKNAVTYNQLPHLAFPILIPEKNNEITSAFPNYYLPKPTARYSIDLFGGIQASHTNIKQFKQNRKNTSVNYLAGFGINYHLRNKFTLTCQFVFSKNNFDHTYTVTENKIVSQIIAISSSPSVWPDTIRYVHANTNYIIRSTESYNFAFGTEYRILQKNKLTLGAFAMLNVSATKYNYGYTRDFGKEVLTYVKGDPDPPYTNLVSPSFKEGDLFQEETSIKTSLMPGILFGYRLSNKTTLLIKPACLIPLSETKFTINSSAFTLKEKGILLNVGLRINL